MKLTRRIATVHTNQHDHIPLAYRQFTKLPSYVTSCMMLHRIQVYYVGRKVGFTKNTAMRHRRRG